MNTSKKIRRELAIQAEHEGLTDNIELLYRVIDCLTTGNQWRYLVNVKHHSYGLKSYECHRFYYAKAELIALTQIDK